MQCVFCSHGETRVLDSRENGAEIRRRRECAKCERRFTTYEKPAVILTVIKKDGRREDFSREKISKGISLACEKRPITPEQIESMVDDIESKLYARGNEVSTKAIGDLVMKRLRKLDEIAYIRFASVCKSFNDLKHLEQELKTLKAEARSAE
jgi:transcriptional repressor NrdR